MIRAALYARVSTIGHGQDVQLQLDELRQVAAMRGWRVVDEYVDDGVSGAKTSRPGLDRMLADVQAGRLDLVAVWKLDRLGRSLPHLLTVLDQLAGAGVGFASLRDAGVDTTSPTGRLLLQVLGAFAEFERAMVRERVRAGVKRAQAAGRHCGRPRQGTDDKALLAARTLLDQGWSWRAVAEATSMQKDTLRRRLSEAGLLEKSKRPRNESEALPG